MSKITLIGDVHGKINSLQEIYLKLPDGQRSIQLGDMGFGFVMVPEFPDQHRFIRGNHDNPAKARAHRNYLGDFGYLPSEDIFYVSGASSIDHALRVEGRSWWPDEELSFLEMTNAVELYKTCSPKIVISHECPTLVNHEMLKALQGPYFAAKQTLASSRTCQALQMMLEAHQPEQWFFGHYHVDREGQLGHTTFRCLAELSTTQVEV